MDPHQVCSLLPVTIGYVQLCAVVVSALIAGFTYWLGHRGGVKDGIRKVTGDLEGKAELKVVPDAKEDNRNDSTG